jgi:hypothetical protein
LLGNKKLYIIVEYNKRINDYNFYMNDFWNNISRYPRFFISSVAGLILVIITPFKNLFKIKKLRIFVILGFILCVGILYFIILNMAGL